MGSKDDTSKMIKPKPGVQPRKAGPIRRRTRMFALEPRVLFDGALIADIVSEAGQVADAGAGRRPTIRGNASRRGLCPPAPRSRRNSNRSG